jgi:putative ATP-dependent endonuclease of OLD family
MYISELNIKGYKTFKDEFTIKLNKNLTILVGENGSGKTTVIDAIRLLLNEDEYGRLGISNTDFHRPFDKPAKDIGANTIDIKSTFLGLTTDEQVAYLPWLDAFDNSKAYLNLKVDNKETPRGKYKRVIWGGESVSSIFEWELMDTLACIYLPPLRDANKKLEAYKGSRLSRLFRNDKPKNGEVHELEEKVQELNDELIKTDVIKLANEQIKGYLKKSLGSVLGQDVNIQFSETSFDRIVEKLRLVFFPRISTTTDKDLFREISENSLGYNNILYLATVLAELVRAEDCLLKVLLVEEPEAHLHPQLQIRLMQYLNEQAEESNIQIIVTTHSSTITAAVDLESINVLTVQSEGNPKSTLIKDCEIKSDTKFFLERWLDVTKSTLFFAKGLVFVEGIAEALVLKELAKRVIKQKYTGKEDAPTSLEDFGVSIINLNGIYFRHFFQLFQGYQLEANGSKRDVDFIPIRCSGITDCDPLPVKDTKPTKSKPCECGNSQSTKFQKELNDNNSNFCKIFTNLKTLEYDLGMEGNNLQLFFQMEHESLTNNTKNKRYVFLKSKIDYTKVKIENKARICSEFLHKEVEKGKGEFAQRLTWKLVNEHEEFTIPKYIEDAIIWAIGE